MAGGGLQRRTSKLWDAGESPSEGGGNIWGQNEKWAVQILGWDVPGRGVEFAWRWNWYTKEGKVETCRATEPGLNHAWILPSSGLLSAGLYFFFPLFKPIWIEFSLADNQQCPHWSKCLLPIIDFKPWEIFGRYLSSSHLYTSSSCMSHFYHQNIKIRDFTETSRFFALLKQLEAWHVHSNYGEVENQWPSLDKEAALSMKLSPGGRQSGEDHPFQNKFSYMICAWFIYIPCLPPTGK